MAVLQPFQGWRDWAALPRIAPGKEAGCLVFRLELGILDFDLLGFMRIDTAGQFNPFGVVPVPGCHPG